MESFHESGFIGTVRVKPRARLCELWEPRTDEHLTREAATEIFQARIFCLDVISLSPLRGSLMKAACENPKLAKALIFLTNQMAPANPWARFSNPLSLAEG
jgi:hypothetical protein